MTIQAIPTTYRGITYRSRLEARWAVLFHVLEWRVDYEPNGYVVGGVPYLPDFYLHDGNVFIEVKPFEPTAAEWHKAESLSAASHKPVLIVVGAPSREVLAPILEAMERDGFSVSDRWGWERARRAIERARGESFGGIAPPVPNALRPKPKWERDADERKVRDCYR